MNITNSVNGTDNDVLQDILQHKRQEVARQSADYPLVTMQASLAQSTPPLRDFAGTLAARIKLGQTAVIAEIKRASPSKGLISRDLRPEVLARNYARGGAACISVLTDAKFFQGCLADLLAARAACELPVLRKDFIISPYQVYQTRAIGADAILLIAKAMTADELGHLVKLSQELGLDVLLEVHDATELTLALALKPDIIGINNRNLRTFAVTLDTTINLTRLLPADCLVVSESGINNRADIQLLHSHGVHGFLIGESLVRAADPKQYLMELLTP